MAKTTASQVESPCAVIATGGKQYLVQAGDEVRVEKLEQEPSAEVVFSDLLGNAKQVKTTVLEHGRSKKVSSRLFRNKVRASRFPRGHRQAYTLLKVVSIA